MQNLKCLLHQVAKCIVDWLSWLLSLLGKTMKTKNNISGISPRLKGIEEQFERAKLFFNEAIQSTDKLDKFRRFVAAIYFANAIAEIMVDAAKYKEIKVAEDELKKILAEKLPYCSLLRDLRLHDFHRVCLLERPGTFVKGPIKLIACKGMVQVQYTAKGPVVTTTGDSQFQDQRSLIMQDDKVFDKEQGVYVSLQEVLSKYLAAVPEAIEKFRSLQVKKSD